jgi:hypothetical protein
MLRGRTHAEKPIERPPEPRDATTTHAEMLAIVEELERLVERRKRPRHSGRLLGGLLVTRGLMVESQLEFALAHQAQHGGRLGEVVVELGLVPEQAVVEILAEQLRIDVLDVNRTSIDLKLGVYLPAGDARHLRAVPYRSVDGVIEVVVADPTVEDLLPQLTQLMHVPVRLVMTTKSVVDELLARMYGAVGRS